MKPIFQIARIVVQELIHERVFYLLLSFCGVSLALSLALGQLTYAERLKLTLDFMLAGQQVSLLLFSIFMTISLLHREISQGSVAMILSKPLSRTSYLLGKFLGELQALLLISIAMGVLTYLFCSSFNEPFSAMALFQATFLILCEAAVVTSLTFFFAVNANGMTSAIAMFCLILVGHLNESTVKTLASPLARGVWKTIRFLIPNLEVFNMKALASYHQTLGIASFGWAFCYAILCVMLYLTLASISFSQKDIP